LLLSWHTVALGLLHGLRRTLLLCHHLLLLLLHHGHLLLLLIHGGLLHLLLLVHHLLLLLIHGSLLHLGRCTSTAHGVLWLHAIAHLCSHRIGLHRCGLRFTGNTWSPRALQVNLA